MSASKGVRVEKESRGVQVEKRGREGVRVEKERVEKECE